METIPNDVKGTESSTVDTGVKPPTSFEQVTEQFISKMTETAEPPADEEEEAPESDGLEKTKTEGDKGTEKGAEETEAETETPAEEESTEETEEEAKHEEAVPYDRFKEVNEKAQAYEPLAQRQYQIEKYLHDGGVTPQEFQESLELMVLRKQNPAEYAKRMQTQLEDVEVATGSRLPTDLQKEVDDGTLSEARAKELAQLRAKSRGLEKKTTLTEEQQVANHVQQLAGSLHVWAQHKGQIDPQFKPKKSADAPDGMFEMVTERFQFLMHNKDFRKLSVEEVNRDIETAYNDVKKRFKQFAPPPAKKKVLKNTGVSTQQKEPKTIEDVMNTIATKHGIG